MTVNQTTTTEKNYFNLTIEGLGYLNSIKEVTTTNGSFYACTLNALSGSTDSPEYTRFDITVAGKKANELIARCIKAVESEQKVLIGFKLSNLKAETFVYNKGERAGETMISLKARLISVSWIKVGSNMVYKAEDTKNVPAQADTNVSTQSYPEDSF